MSEYSSYREALEKYEQKAYEDYDKAILTLSGGALVLSFTFVKDIAGNIILFKCSLVVAWIAWVLSLTSTLLSYLSSQFALRRAIKILEAEDEPKDIFGISHYITICLSVLAAVFFIVGVVSFTIFANKTLEVKAMALKPTETKEQKVDVTRGAPVPVPRKDEVKPPKKD